MRSSKRETRCSNGWASRIRRIVNSRNAHQQLTECASATHGMRIVNSIVYTNWVPVIVAPMDVDIETCLRVASSAIQPALCEFSGQGLTAFDPSGSDQQNVIYMVLRDEDNTIADWVTKDDIHLKLSTQCVLAGLKLSYTLDFDDYCWKVMYSVSGANMGAHIEFSITILNGILRQCSVQVM